MFKYEQEINGCNEQYREAYKNMIDTFHSLDIEMIELSDEDNEILRYETYGDMPTLWDVEEVDMYADKGTISANARLAINKYYDFVNGIGYIRVREGKKLEEMYPAMSLPVREYEFANGRVNLPGLYFLGMIGHHPNGENDYLVKIGSAKNVEKRVNQYRSYNPMVYHNDLVYIIENDAKRAEMERKAHGYLANVANARAAHAMEWFYVDEETYYNLCKNPWGEIFEEA